LGDLKRDTCVIAMESVAEILSAALSIYFYY